MSIVLITSQQEKPTERPEHLSLKYSKYCVEYSKYCVTVRLKSVNSLVQHKRPLANSSEYVRMVIGVIKCVLGPFYRIPCTLSTYLKVLTRALIITAPHQVVWSWFTGHKMFLTFGSQVDSGLANRPSSRVTGFTAPPDMQ